MTNTTASHENTSLEDHVEALRHTLIRIFAIIICGVIISFFFSDAIISFLTSPIFQIKTSSMTTLTEERIEYIRLKNNSQNSLPYQLPKHFIDIVQMSPEIKEDEHNTLLIPSGAWLTYIQPINTTQLVILGPLEGILIALKTSLWVGLVATSPFWLFVLLKFITPALYKHERRLIIPFLFISLVFMVIGGLFAFHVTIPFANDYLSSFNGVIGINLWSLEHYLDYTFFLLFANSLAFEFCVIGIFAVHLGLISKETLSSHRRLAIVLAFIIGALLTPPDVFTQFMLAIPLIILYETVILYARFKNIVRKC